ncbi:hypothetical protein DERP_011132 [Dermatophagoides pteronyssinus]|uniref:Uncharacterized protein n=1 Tax=Dermatophagoides pteronyssinus TaxID=6956 RepID=A0ABQ8J9H0_DERPT|nr:hypothetical protein DERP_011132 [Dermatophagoides pteronyssinus]
MNFSLKINITKPGIASTTKKLKFQISIKSMNYKIYQSNKIGRSIEKNLHFENDDNGGGGRWPSVLWSFKWIITSIDGDDGEIETV